MRLIIFDIDGTLLLNGDVARRAFEHAFESVCGFAPAGDRFSFAGMTDRGIFRRMLSSRGAEERFESLFPRFAVTFESQLRSTYFESEKPFLLPGVPELVDSLHADPAVALAVATGNLRETAAIKLGRFGLERFFPVGSYGGDHEFRSDLFADCVQVAGAFYGAAFDPAASWVVGDTQEDVDAAKAIGLRILGVRTGPDSGFEGADAVVTDLADASVLPLLLG